MNKDSSKQVLSYNPQLIELLKAHHQELSADCDLIFLYAKKKKLTELNHAFRRFATLMDDHWKVERELYMYLDLVVAKYDGTYHDTRSEMRAIALSVNSTINLHINVPITNETLRVFKKDFAMLTKALIARMRYEERHLYKDYSDTLSSI